MTRLQGTFWPRISLSYNASMANPNPLAGVVPQVVHPLNDGETTISRARHLRQGADLGAGGRKADH